MGQGRTAAAGGNRADGLTEGLAGTDKDHNPLRTGDGRIQKVALEHHPGPRSDGDDDGGVLTSLGPVDRHRVRMGQLVEFVELVRDLLVLVRQDGEALVVEVEEVTTPTVPLKTPFSPLS